MAQAQKEDDGREQFFTLTPGQHFSETEHPNGLACVFPPGDFFAFCYIDPHPDSCRAMIMQFHSNQGEMNPMEFMQQQDRAFHRFMSGSSDPSKVKLAMVTRDNPMSQMMSQLYKAQFRGPYEEHLIQDQNMIVRLEASTKDKEIRVSTIKPEPPRADRFNLK